MSRIRVVQVSGAMDFGGAENVIAHLALNLDPARFDVSVVCTRGVGALGEELRAKGVNVVLTRPYVRARRYLAPLDLLEAFRVLRPDVVHTHGEPPLSAAGPLGFLGLLPFWAHTFHYGNYPYESRKRMWLERTLCRNASVLIAVADQQRATIIQHHGIDPTRIRTLMNGVRDNPWVDDSAARERKRAEFGFRAGDVIVGTVAVLSRQKGVSYLLQAAKDVLQACDRARFLIVGGGPLETQLRGEASALGVSDRVHFTGWRKDILELLPTFDMFVMSSLWEAMPLTLLEAMAARRAIIATDVGDNATLLGGYAIIVPPSNSHALAGAILSLMHDSAARVTLGSDAQQLFKERYTIAHMVTEHERLYEEAAMRKRRNRHLPARP